MNPPWVTRIDAGTFIPRRYYGDYLHDVLNEAEASAKPDVRLYRLVDKALRLQEKANGIQVSLESGLQVQVDRVVFAAGNFPPGNPRLADPGFYDSARYHGNPWATAVISDLLHTQACLLVGSGLTMVDWVMALRDANYGGTIHVVSRRGLSPVQSLKPVSRRLLGQLKVELPPALSDQDRGDGTNHEGEWENELPDQGQYPS